MRFHLTLKIPGRNGSPTQFAICDHPARSLKEFHDELNSNDHILVTEVNTDRDTRELVPGDEVSLGQLEIAKATRYVERRPHH